MSPGVGTSSLHGTKSQRKALVELASEVCRADVAALRKPHAPPTSVEKNFVGSGQ